MLNNKNKIKGFSLIELAIVLLITGLLFSSIVTGFARYASQARIRQAKMDLQQINEALIGYAIKNGHFPCSDEEEDGSNSGTENRSGGICADEHGFVPSADLGVPMRDPWGLRYFYSVNNEFSRSDTPFSIVTTSDYVVKSAAGVTENIATAVVIFAYSTGPNQSGEDDAKASADEEENYKVVNNTFVSRPPDTTFDDVTTWLSENVVIAKMVDAERLP